MQKKDEEVDRKIARAENGTIEEMEEREARRLNVVFHKVGEFPRVEAPGAEKIEWDMKSCMNIFEELRLDIPLEAIKFSRRLGDRKEGPRPMVVGFHLEADRSKLLRAASWLENTRFKEVNVGPDLTKRQREKEASLRDEVDRRNQMLTEEDKAKNLQWAVVRGRGERRKINTTARQFQHQRPGSSKGRRGRWAPIGGPAEARDQEVAEETEAPTRSMTTREGGKSNNKRRAEEEEMEVEGRPPEKRQQERS